MRQERYCSRASLSPPPDFAEAAFGMWRTGRIERQGPPRCCSFSPSSQQSCRIHVALTRISVLRPITVFTIPRPKKTQTELPCTHLHPCTVQRLFVHGQQAVDIVAAEGGAVGVGRLAAGALARAPRILAGQPKAQQRAGNEGGDDGMTRSQRRLGGSASLRRRPAPGRAGV